jgi:methylated-DNA-[protein]-cysteine S-methyltransferase
MKTYYSSTQSPIGELLLTGNGTALTGLYMQVHKYGREISADWSRDEAAFKPARAQLAAYFAGESHRFEMPIAMAGTPFQQRVWHALLEIPYGATESYGALASRIGAPKAPRAVGLANGRNPVSIIVPCHRVIGANGSLTGYGGGIERKQWLLAHERSADQRKALAG